MAVRIFVGGLPAGVTADELAQRFKSFGEVEACELVPDKLYATARPNFIPEKFSRNFGYVTLVPNGDKSVSKAMGVYNGAKWRGAVLRCQLAKPSGTEGILREIEDETVKKEEGPPAPAPPSNAPLRIRNPFKRDEVVTAMLQGAPVVTMRLATDVSHQEVPGASAQLQGTWEPINEQEGQRRRTYEEHLRESSDAIRRWNKAARDEDGNSVSGSDLDERSAGSSDSESPVPQRKRPAARGAAVPPPKERTRVDDFLARQQTRPELPVKRTRIVDFVTEEATGIGGRVPEVDLSRFGSDSDDDGGEPLRIRGRHIPQVDGAADTSSDETSDSESEGGGNTSSSSESGAESSSSDSENGNNGEDKGPDRREEEAMETDIGDSAGTLGQAALASSSAADRMPTGDEEDVTWMAALLPAGAAFFRRDPVAQVEASWRARREGATREYKELRRMALRQTRQRSGAKGQR